MKKIILKINVLLFGCFCIPVSVFGQNTISGSVTDASNQPQPYLSVLLLNSSDSVYVNGGVTDGEGKFKVIEKNPGNYLLTIKSIGSAPYYKNVVLNDKNVDLGTIVLAADPRLLKEVNVIGTKKLIEFNGDKMVMDLSVSPVTSGLNAFELLGKVPGVTVNTQSQTIQIAGKKGVMVMIDGIPTNLSGDELANMLKSMKSDEFEKVEVISNPSAKYDAEGTSGIINLKTKSGKVYGTNVTINLGGGYSYYEKFGSYPKYNEGFSVSVKRKKVTAYINLSHNRGTDFVWSEEYRSFLDDKKSAFEKQYSTELDKGRNHYYNGRLNLDFNLSKRTTFGFSLSGSLFDGNKKSRQEQKINNGNDLNLYTIGTDKRISDDVLTSTANAHIKHVFDTLGTELLIDFDVVSFNLDTRNSFDGKITSANTSQETFHNMKTVIDRNSYTLRSSFEKQLTKKIKLEVGYRSRFSSAKNNFASDFVEVDSLKQSTFNFLDNVNAAYLIFKTALTSKMDLELGLRGEHTHTLGKNEMGKKLSEQNYFNLFPSFSLNRKFDSYAWSVGYSRRIARPNFGNFNIFKQFHSPLSYTQGNPKILAALHNSYNVSVTIKDKYLIDLSYIDRKKDINEIIETDTTLIPGRSLTRVSMGNVKGKVSWVTLKGYIPIQVNKLWMINVQVFGGINDYNFTLNEARTKVQQLFWGASCQQNFSITETVNAEINAWVNSGETSGFQTSKSMSAIDFGISKKIFKKNGSLKLSLQDPFNLNNYKATLNYDYLAGTGKYNWDNRAILLNFSYNFGNRNVNTMPWESKFRSADIEPRK